MGADYEVAVIGGGMVGASLALGLARQGLKTALIEETPPRSEEQPSYDDRGLALAVSSQRILAALGLWDQLEVCPISQVHVSEQGRLGCVRMSAGMLGLEALGFTTTARALGRALFAALAERDEVDLICPASATGIETGPDQARALFRRAGGDDALSCKLLVVADGALSKSRAFAGIKARRRDCLQTAIVSNIAIARDHGRTAYERFVPGGLIALLPLAGQRCATVMIVPERQADECLALSDDHYLGRLQQRFGKRLGAFSGLGIRKSYPLFLLKPERQTGERVVLAGNAAHAIHPNGAQGFNLALRDVAGLLQRLGAAGRAGADLGSGALLDSYVRSRRADQRRVIRFTDAAWRVFGGANPLLRASRHAAMFLLDALPALKREFIRGAAGLGPGQLTALEDRADAAAELAL